MEITSKFLGLKIKDNGICYEYSYKPFTHNSKLIDESGQLVAELKRFGWFSLNFKLVTKDGEYLLKCRALNSELTTPLGEIFNTAMSLNFSSNGRELTKLTQDAHFNRYVALEIFSKNHRMALLITSCLFTVRYLHAGSY